MQRNIVFVHHKISHVMTPNNACGAMVYFIIHHCQKTKHENCDLFPHFKQKFFQSKRNLIYLNKQLQLAYSKK